ALAADPAARRADPGPRLPARLDPPGTDVAPALRREGPRRPASRGVVRPGRGRGDAARRRVRRARRRRVPGPVGRPAPGRRPRAAARRAGRRPARRPGHHGAHPPPAPAHRARRRPHRPGPLGDPEGGRRGRGGRAGRPRARRDV
ncbi:MAG: hypothetical protein AVDCRST_MAG54-2116, partial [uncultured Actinomycetospora sp.]